MIRHRLECLESYAMVTHPYKYFLKELNYINVGILKLKPTREKIINILHNNYCEFWAIVVYKFIFMFMAKWKGVFFLRKHRRGDHR